MMKTLRMYDESCRPGSYLRKDLKGDVLYSSYRYKGIRLTFGVLGGGTTRVEDDLTQQMLRAGIISHTQKAACDESIQRAFSTREAIERFDDASVEAIYRHIQCLRVEALGENAFARMQAWTAQQSLTGEWGIDQRPHKEKLLQQATALIFALTEAQWLPVMRKDIETAQRLGKQIFVLYGEAADELPALSLLRSALTDMQVHYLPVCHQQIAFDPALQTLIDRQQAALMFYGEDGLIHCRSLLTDAVVHACPAGYFAQALVNGLEAARLCAVYVPRGLDITAFVPLRERAQLTFWQLWQLQKDHGDGIYACSPAELCRRYPQYFINMYQYGPRCEEAAENCPLRICPDETADPFPAMAFAREKAAQTYLNGFANLHVEAHYFDENGQESPLPYDGKADGSGILVHAVRVKAARQARVISRPEDTPLRQLFARGENGIFSNFLFFMTPKLSALYNDLRADRPPEQADVTAGHLDYMLVHEQGRRMETFPLFEKMCIAMKENGEFLFFNFRLGGGRIRVAEHTFAWQAKDVNAASDAPVQVFTPFLSRADSDADRQKYRRLVGDGRVNLVILQDKIHCLRCGDVVLPSAGVVVSLHKNAAETLLHTLKPLENGYYDVSGLTLETRLDAPDGIESAVWDTVRWAYGGGLTLIRDGRALCDQADMTAWFEQEGWMTPLSRQTQESALHTLSRHPRTAIGCIKDGDMVIMVFSGRTSLSAGADYVHMCRIARRLCPQIDQLMNVDGGASAVLCMVRDGVMTELNCPSTSANSCAGMARPIKTMLYIPAE